jgi:hypothetical protein
MISRKFGLAGVLFAIATTAAAQIPFQLLVSQSNNAITVQNGASLTFVAAVGQSATAKLTATYTGTGQVVISQIPNVFGSSAFTATLPAKLPIVLNPGASVTVTINFSPTSATASSSQMNLPYVETVSTTTGTTTSTTSTANVITLGLQGTAPSFALSYVLQTDQNVVPIQSGGLIPFAPTLVGATAQAALNVTNTGSGPGTVTGISISGSAFKISGKPLLPSTVNSGQTLQVLVLYTPTAVGTDTGLITITFDSGSPVTVNLSGSGTASSFTYSILSTTPPTAISPGGTISLPNTQVGQSSTITIRVLNSGNANGTVSSVNIAGQGFSLSTLVLPNVLAPNASLTFNITFTPTQPGAQTGTLIVNSDTFSLSGTGLGALLVYSYVAGGSTITLGAGNNSVVFSPVMVSQSEQLIFDVKNAGTLPATISNIGVGSGPYVVSGLPPLPVTLAPNADFQITIKFTPTTVGPANGTLLLDATTIALIGSGTAPPPLPAYTIAGPSGNTAPMTQPTVGLTLASAYPVAITGVLTMSIAGALPADPAVQFATGGRTVAFTIPANQTSAVFGTQGTQLGLQTGTVASTITLTPSFATQAGNVDLTPAAPSSLQFTVAPAVPSLIAMQLGSLSATGFTIQVTGFSTPRSLKSMAVQFTTAPGFSMPTTQFTIDVSQVSTVWYDSTASQAFGSLFTISVPFTFQGTVPAGQSILKAITSVSVTMSNALGASNSLQAAVP